MEEWQRNGRREAGKEGGNSRMGRIVETMGIGGIIECKEEGVRSTEGGKKERRKGNSSGEEEEVVRTAERGNEDEIKGKQVRKEGKAAR